MRKARGFGRRALVALLLAAAVTAAFSPVLGNGFVNLDDEAYVLNNPRVTPGLTAGGVVWALSAFRNSNWHPLTWISHMLDVSLFGLQPWGHHLTSLLLHLANTLLLFLLLERISGALAPAAVVALLFGIHPLHVESVAWVAERKDVLSTLFWLAATAAYLRYVRRPGTGRYLLVAVLFALGLTAKPMLVTLPLVLLLLDWWPLGRRRPAAALLLEKAPLLLLSALSGLITLGAQVQGEAVASLELYPVTLRLENALTTTVGYLGRTLVPRGLSVPVPHPDSFPLWEPLLAAALVLGLTFLAISQRSARPCLLLGWGWYLITLAPVIGLVQVGSQASADRYTYVPLIGLFIAAAWGAADILGRTVPRGLLVLSGSVLVAVLLLLTQRQALVWRDSVTLFTHALEVDPGNLLAHYYLGNQLSSTGRAEAAAEHYRRAAQLKPTFIQPRINLGATLMGLGRPQEAEREFREVLRLRPGHLMALQNLALSLARQGRSREALSLYRDLLALKPAEADDYYNLALILLDVGDRPAARSALAALRRVDPARAEQLAPDFR